MPTSRSGLSLRGLLGVSLLLAMVDAARNLAAPPNPGGQDPVSRYDDHQNMMDQLGIKTLRRGPDPNNQGTFDEAKANPYKDSMPDALTMKDGTQVTRADQWPNRRAEILEDFEREVYGRIPKNVPKVTWEVTSTLEGNSGGIPTVTKMLVGHVDNSVYPQIAVNIQASYTVPANATAPVPIMIEFGFMFGGGFGPGRGSLSTTQPARRGPTSAPVGPIPAAASTRPFPGGFGRGPAGPHWTQQAIAHGWGYGFIFPNTIQEEAAAMCCCRLIAALGVAWVSASVMAGDAPGPLADDGRAGRMIEQVPIAKIEPAEEGFYAKRLDYHGLPIKGADVVADEAFYEAWRRINRLLVKNPVILRNLLGAGAEVHIIGRNQGQTDLPEFRSQKGVPLRENPLITLDERARGMGGRQCSCGEENLLKLPEDRYRGRDILSHEFTHTIHGYGVSRNIKQLITETYRKAREKKLWETPAGTPIYGGSNEKEYLAELTLWYVGGRGDWPATMGPMEPGPQFIKTYDPEGYKLVDDLFNGRLDVQELTPRSPKATTQPAKPGTGRRTHRPPLESRIMVSETKQSRGQDARRVPLPGDGGRRRYALASCGWWVRTA